MASYMRFSNRKVVDHVERLNNSRNGNPKYRVTFDNDEVMTTQADVTWVYGVAFDRLEGTGQIVTYHVTASGKLILDDLKSLLKP